MFASRKPITGQCDYSSLEVEMRLPEDEILQPNMG